MKTLQLFIICILAMSLTSDEELVILFSIPSKSDFFTTDNFGNSYLIKGDEMKKYSATGELLKVYSAKSLGKITTIDASNPLRVLVFYKEFSSIVFLDDLLSQNGDPLNLMDLSLEQSDVVCSSFNNGLWFFDRQNANLIRMDENLQTVVNTGNLNQLLNLKMKPNFMMEYDGFVYVNNPEQGIMVFDIYGTFSKTIPIKNLKSFQVKEDKLFYFLPGEFHVYRFKFLTEAVLKFKSGTDIRLERDKYYIYNADSVAVMGNSN